MSLAENIYKLREMNRLSQEEFAKLFNISHQAVQKWENDITQPTLSNIIAIAKHFNVSVDALLLNSDGRIIEEMRSAKDIFPSFDGMHEWESYAKGLELEYRQSTEEGYDLGIYHDLFLAASKIPDSIEKDQIADVLFRIVSHAPMRKDYPYTEPSGLSEIKALRTSFDFQQHYPDNAQLKNKVEGAWLGRICGCLLGKPVEGIKTNELIPLLKESHNYPMHRYILSSDITDEACEKYNFRLKGQCWADTITSAPADDDTNYTVMLRQILPFIKIRTANGSAHRFAAIILAISIRAIPNLPQKWHGVMHRFRILKMVFTVKCLLQQ